jgi:predicted tellurium resistance membrane protein TerC
MIFAWVGDPQIWAALLTLTAIEIVLGVDNVILVSVLADRLSQHRRARARRLGLILALATRLALLACIVWATKLTAPVFEGFGRAFSSRDVILIAGGLFLVYSSTREIHGHIEADEPNGPPRAASTGFARIVAQMVLLDMVFSLDSIITAVGMANEFWVMAVAIVITMAVMLVVATPVAGFINRHPTVKILVLSFLLLIGTALVADGLGFHVPRGYIYAAIGFSIGVEALNQQAARRRRANSKSSHNKVTARRRRGSLKSSVV